MGKKNQPGGEILKGTLDMMILRTLARAETLATATPSRRSSNTHLRMCWMWSRDRSIRRFTAWKIEAGYQHTETQNDRKAKFYRLTAAGKKQLTLQTSRWRQMARAIGLVMSESVAAEGGDE